MLLQAAVHVLVIHAPDSVFIAAQGRKLRFAAEIIQNMGQNHDEDPGLWLVV